MKPSSMCSVPGCEKSAKSKSLCIGHYRRLQRYGSATGGYFDHEAPRRYFFDTIEKGGDDCFTWPFGKTREGYGIVRVNGVRTGAHRAACELRNGPPPVVKLAAAHTCGNGHLGCFNPLHLKWATYAENCADMEKHGTKLLGSRANQAKLSEADVLEIVSLSGKETNRLTAERYGVTESNISCIRRGQNWNWLTKIRA